MGVKVATYREDYNRWHSHPTRYEKETEALIEKGEYVEKTFTGPAGTTIYFDNNILHKAKQSTGKDRYVVVYMMKPIDREIRPRISETHTGTNWHVDTFMDPEFCGVVKKGGI